MQKLIFVNADNVSVDLTDGLKYGITEWKGLSENDLDVQSQQVPFHDGAVYLDSLLGERTLPFTLSINDAGDLRRRYELKRELISLLNPKLGEGYLYYTNDFISKRIKVISDLPVFQNKNSNDSGTLKASLSFTACDPYWEDIEETIVDLSKGLFSVENTGDVPVPVVVDFYTNSIKNLCLTNKTTGKKIQFSNEMTKPININTGFGTKSVTNKNLKWKFGISENLFSICYAEDLALYCITGSDVVYLGYDLKNLTAHACDYSFRKVTYGAGLFIGITYSTNKLYSSPDGITWTLLNTELIDITYSSELNLFVAIGEDGKIITSSDGITWTTGISGTSNNLNCVIYNSENNLFVVIGDSGTILTSSDGSVWTVQTSGTSNNLNCVIYNSENNLFVAGGLGVILTSSDGSVWTVIDISDWAEYSYVDNLAYNSSLFLACMHDGKVYSSPDGITWTLLGYAQSYYEGSPIFDYIYYEGRLAGIGGTGMIYLSDDFVITYDGTTFNEDVEFINGSYGDIKSVIYSQKYNKFVAVGSYFNLIITSSDGINWDKKYILNHTLYDITYSSELDLFVAVGTSSDSHMTVFTSSDAETWNSNVLSVEGLLLNVTYSSELGLFVAVGSDGSILTSSDGITWTARTSGTSSLIMCVTYSSERNLFVAGGDSVVLTSSDGITWTVQNTSVSLYDVIYSSKLKKFVGTYILYNDSPVVISADGINWISIISNKPIFCIRYISELDLFVATGYDGEIYTTYDLFSWTTYDSGTSRQLQSIDYNPELNSFAVVGDYGIIGHSYYDEADNLISELTSDSDMTFALNKGNNTLLLTGTGTLNGKLSFRNRYVGV